MAARSRSYPHCLDVTKEKDMAVYVDDIGRAGESHASHPVTAICAQTQNSVTPRDRKNGPAAFATGPV